MNYLVTGGAGFIGSRVAARLVREPGARVAVLDNLSTGSLDNVPPECRLVVGDINNPAALHEALLGADVVVHLAAYVSIRGSFTFIDNDLRDNCRGTLCVLRAAGEHGVKRVVFASSMAVYGEPASLPVSEDAPAAPGSPYGLSKRRGEMYGRALAEKFGYAFVALRYFNTYGVGQTPSDYVGVTTAFINMVLDDKPMTIYGDGSQTRDLVWVEDVAAATVLAAKSTVEGIYNVAAGVEVSINDLAAMIQRCVGGRWMHTEAPLGEVRRIRADISRARRDLGYEPRGVLAEQLPAVVDYWRQRRVHTSAREDIG